MARNVTLTRLLDELRAEAGLSLSPAHNNQVRDPHIITLQREQERLWEDFAWPHLRVKRYIPMEAGQRTYDLTGALNPAGTVTPDLSFDRVERVTFKDGGLWLPVGYGITDGHLAAQDSDLDSRADPVFRWERTEQDQIEVWPIPETSGIDDSTSEEYQQGYLCFEGIRNLRPLVADADRCDLDSRLIVLFAAGSILVANGDKGAQVRLEAANKHYGKLKGVQIKTTSFRMFGIGEEPQPRRPVIGHYRPAV